MWYNTLAGEVCHSPVYSPRASNPGPTERLNRFIKTTLGGERGDAGIKSPRFPFNELQRRLLFTIQHNLYGAKCYGF